MSLRVGRPVLCELPALEAPPRAGPAGPLQAGSPQGGTAPTRGVARGLVLPETWPSAQPRIRRAVSAVPRSNLPARSAGTDARGAARAGPATSGRITPRPLAGSRPGLVLR